MVLRVTKLCLNLLLWASTILVLLFCALLIRLYVAPVDLSFVKGTIIERTSAALPGWTVSYEDASVGWDFANMRPWVRLSHFRAEPQYADFDLWAPRSEILLSRYTVLGKPGLAEATVTGLEVRVYDFDGGASPTPDAPPEPTFIDDLFRSDGSPDAEAFKPVAAFVLDLAQQLRTQTPDLHHLTLLRSGITLVRESGADARFDLPRFRAELVGGDLHLDGRVNAVLGGSPAQVTLDATTNQSEGRVSVAMTLSELVPASIANHFQLVGPLTYLKFPAALDLTMSLSRATGLERVDVIADLGAGEVSDFDVYPRPAKVRYGTIEALYTPEVGDVKISRIDLGLSPGTVHGTGRVYWIEGGGRPGLEVEAALDRATIADIISYWPRETYENGVPRGGRAWINQNMLDGEAYEVDFRLGLGVDGKGKLPNGSVWDVRFQFRDIDTYVMQTVPPFYEASGHGYIFADKLDISIESAKIEGMPVRDSRLIINNLSDKDNQAGDIRLRVEGALPKLLTLANRQPLRVAEKANIPIDRLGGTADLSLELSIPFQKGRADEAVYAVTARVSDTKVIDMLDGEGITDGLLELTVDNDQLAVEGDVLLNGVPLHVRWDEDFKAGRAGPDVQTTRLVATGRVDAASLDALNVPVEAYLTGPVDVFADFRGRSLALSDAVFRADLTDAHMHIDELGWQKPAGRPGLAEGDLRLGENGGGRVPALMLSGEDLDAELDFTWGAEEGQLSLLIDARRIGDNTLMAQIRQTGDNAFDVEIAAERFDLRPFLGVVDADDPRQVAEATKERKPIETDFTIAAHADEILMLNGEVLRDASVDLAFMDGAPDRADITALMGDSAVPVTLKIGPYTAYERTLTLTTENAGELMRGMAYFSHLRGGSLELTGVTRGWGDTLEISAEARAEDAYLYPVSELGPEVTMGTIDGLEEMVDEGGVKLNTIKMPFTYNRGLLDIDKLIANGNALGMTMEGQMETNLGKVNINGVYVPAYGINSLLGSIPLFGGLFSGGEGEGLIGFAYRVKGTMANPTVSVSAASGFAPGFLRTVFEGGKGKVTDVDVPAEPEGADGEPQEEDQEGGS